MLILPKVPHSLRTLTSSLGRVLDASISSVAGGAQPSVTFTSSGANVYPVIGGGGPFTSNHALLGGGALTHTGHGVGTGMAHLNWTPTSGGGAGAGRSSGGGGQTFHGYTVRSTASFHGPFFFLPPLAELIPAIVIRVTPELCSKPTQQQLPTLPPSSTMMTLNSRQLSPTTATSSELPTLLSNSPRAYRTLVQKEGSPSRSSVGRRCCGCQRSKGG
jgi:hypothetical protein